MKKFKVMIFAFIISTMISNSQQTLYSSSVDQKIV